MSILLRFRSLFLALFFIGIVAAVVSILARLGYGITYVVSQSMPSGFYVIVPPQQINRYDIVQFRPPETTVKFLQEHHWGSPNGLLLKYVYGMPRDFVCNKDGELWINAKKVAPIYVYYAPGQKLPLKNFCAKLGDDEYLLLSKRVARSFDGRYFGPVKRGSIRGLGVRL